MKANHVVRMDRPLEYIRVFRPQQPSDRFIVTLPRAFNGKQGDSCIFYTKKDTMILMGIDPWPKDQGLRHVSDDEVKSSL